MVGQDNLFPEGDMGFACSNCQGLVVSGVQQKAKKCFKHPNLNTLQITSPKCNRWKEMYFGKLANAWDTQNDFSASFAPGLWKFSTGASVGKKGIIKQSKGTLTGTWILPATSIWHKGMTAFALDECEFKMKFYLKKMEKGGAIQYLFKTLSNMETYGVTLFVHPM